MINLKSLDLESFFHRIRIPYKVSNTREVYICCPFCGDERYRHYFSMSTKVNYCHNCEFKGDFFKFLSELWGCSYGDAIRKLEEGDFYSLSAKEDIKPREPIRLPLNYEKFGAITSKNAAYWTYLTEIRKLQPSTIIKYNIGYCRSGMYKGRVIVPVYDRGELVNWIARSILRNEPKKVFACPQAEQSKYLFNLDEMQDEVVLVEGVFDALTIPDIAVASFGKKLSTAQVDKLYNSGIKKVIFCWDGDAVKETLKTARQVSCIFDVSVVQLPQDKDPNSMDEAELRFLVQTAKQPSNGELLRSAI